MYPMKISGKHMYPMKYPENTESLNTHAKEKK
jgi:hypothetical protein